MTIVPPGDVSATGLDRVGVGQATDSAEGLEGAGLESQAICQNMTGNHKQRQLATRPWKASPKAGSFSVGLEGGLERDASSGTLACFAWMAILGARGGWGTSRTASFDLPPPIARLIEDGLELGDADDKFFKRTGSKAGEGVVGLLTHGIIDRAAYYEHALVMALIPFTNASIYAGEASEAATAVEAEALYAASSSSSSASMPRAPAAAAPPSTKTALCRRCHSNFDVAANSSTACRHHSELWSGETAQRWKDPGDDRGLGEIVEFYQCCGSMDRDSPGCHAAPHVSYDEELPTLYKVYS
jgi:non-canonical (house-cleaning) NTP pyrophosphatase